MVRAFEEDRKEQEVLLNMRNKLDMNDRKHKYTDDQLDKFIEFKDLVARTIKD